MATVKRRSTVPYYAAAGTWVIYALLFPLYRVPHFLFVAVVSGVVFFIMNAVCGTVEVTVPDPPKKEETTGNPELDKMIRDGNLAISEMKRLNDSIKDAKISADIDADMLLIDFVRDHGCYSVKRGCETSARGFEREDLRAGQGRPQKAAADPQIYGLLSAHHAQALECL